MKSYFEPNTEWGELVCVHWWGGGEGGESVWNYKTILWFCRQDWLSSSGEFQSKQGWGQHCYFMPAYTATDQTPTKSNWFQGNNQLNQLCFFLFLAAVRTFVPVVEIPVCHWNAEVISSAFSLVQSRPRNPSNWKGHAMYWNAMLQTFNDRQNCGHPTYL